MWGTKSGASKPHLVNQFFFWSSFFFGLWSSFHVLLWSNGCPPFLFVTLPLGYFQCDKYNHLLLKDEIWFLLFHSPRQTIFPGRLKSEIKSLTKTTTDLLLLSLGRIKTKVAVSPIKLGPVGFRLLKKISKWVQLNIALNLLKIWCYSILILLHHKQKRKNVRYFSSSSSSLGKA